MPEEEKKDEGTQETQGTQGTPGNPGAAPESNGASNAEDLEAIKAELDEEKQAKATAEAALAEKDKRIAELQASLNVVQQAGEAALAELTQVKEAHTRAVSKYLEAARALNSTIPKDVIAGSTIEEIDASVAKALSIAESVKKALETQAKEVKVPAGAPTRGEIPLEVLSPREKIAAGIQQKGGTI
jgi:vacuolar-type H+-ATPase subunit I/STV1